MVEKLPVQAQVDLHTDGQQGDYRERCRQAPEKILNRAGKRKIEKIQAQCQEESHKGRKGQQLPAQVFPGGPFAGGVPQTGSNANGVEHQYCARQAQHNAQGKALFTIKNLEDRKADEGNAADPTGHDQGTFRGPV